jgi:hypothetical protein
LSCFQVSKGELSRRGAECGIEGSSRTEGGGTEAGVECCISMELRSVPDLLLFLIVKFLAFGFEHFEDFMAR